MNHRQPNPQYSRTPTADSRILNKAESSIQPNPQYSRILNHFSEQIIDGDIFNELPTAERRTPNAERRTPTVESSIQPNAERQTPNADSRFPMNCRQPKPQSLLQQNADSRILNPFSEQFI